jgi:hypothetical protein
VAADAACFVASAESDAASRMPDFGVRHSLDKPHGPYNVFCKNVLQRKQASGRGRKSLWRHVVEMGEMAGVF